VPPSPPGTRFLATGNGLAVLPQALAPAGEPVPRVSPAVLPGVAPDLPGVAPDLPGDLPGDLPVFISYTDSALPLPPHSPADPGGWLKFGPRSSVPGSHTYAPPRWWDGVDHARSHPRQATTPLLLRTFSV